MGTAKYAVEPRRMCILALQLSILLLTKFILSDARASSAQLNFKGKGSPSALMKKKKFKSTSHLGIYSSNVATSNTEPYGIGGYGTNSPFSLPPFESLSSPSPSPSLSPSPSPSPSPSCIYPPAAAGTGYGPSPPQLVPSPRASPPVYQQQLPPPPLPPPQAAGIIPLPSPDAPPPPHVKGQFAVWCVAKPTVPDTIIQEAMDYACGTGADCESIQPNGPCYQPSTLLSHASYAFNSYWQKAKQAGGTCDFGGTAMLVTTDPSFDKCNFVFT